MNFFAQKLLKWYKINKRDLPWRQTSDPYKIWLSEVILQQTQVIQGLNYYQKFVNQYVSIRNLANAPSDEVMKLWQGLGYYSRARNLHAAAKSIVKEQKGIFPKTYQSIRQLKGVGDYTAAAIASFAFNLPYAVIDGNVYRVLSRVFGINEPIDTTTGKKYFAELANELLPEKNIAEYNQAIMEFGAIYCRPSKPDCPNCIFNSKCKAFASHKVEELPVKSKKIKIKKRYLNYVVLLHKGNAYICKRTQNDIWQGLYEFVLIEMQDLCKADDILAHKKIKQLLKGNTYKVKNASKIYKHVLSHQHLYTQFITLEISKPLQTPALKKVKLTELHKYALPRLLEKFIKDNNISK